MARLIVATETETPRSFSNISLCSSRVAVSFLSSCRQSALLWAGSSRIFARRPGEGFEAICLPEAFSLT